MVNIPSMHYSACSVYMAESGQAEAAAALYSEVKVGEVLSESFGMTCGLRQGCVLSPLLFSSYINSLVEKLKAAGVGVECRGRLITALLYADDAVLFADNEEGMRVSLEVLSRWCKQ